MPIRCVCPNGHALRVKDKLAGKQGVCPTCKAEFQVPALAEAELVDAAPADPPGPPAAPAPPPSGGEAAVEWRVALPEGEQFGPTVPTLFAQWIAAGRVPADALVWRTGWDEWRRADDPSAGLPAPLPATGAPPSPPPVETPPAATPPQEASPPPETTEAAQPPQRPAPSTDIYARRRKQQARRRRTFTVALAVVCVVLTGALIALMVNGPLSDAFSSP